MRIDPLGESALILRDLPCPASMAAFRLQDAKGVAEAYAAFDAVGLILDGEVSLDDLLARLEIPMEIPDDQIHTIPVLYDGEDLAEVAHLIGLTPEEIVRLHAREYECRAVGFCPGFAYLAPLPPELDLPRRDSPRPRVAPGTVALAAGMTAIYPLERPGGWWLIGRTPLVLVDEADCYFPIKAGDRVRFAAINPEEFESLKGKRL